MYKEPTIRALVEQELAEFQSVRGRASTIPWYLVDPDNFDDWSEDDDDFSSSESDDEDEIYTGDGEGNLLSKCDEVDDWETSSWKVESGGADTKQKSVQVETDDERSNRGSPASPSPSPTFIQAFSISGPSDQSGSAASSPAHLSSPSTSGCLECGTAQYGQQHFLPIPPPPLSSMPADLGHLNDDDMDVLEEEASSQNVMESSPSDAFPNTSPPNPSTSPLNGAIDSSIDASSTQSPPRNPARPGRQRRGGGKGTPVDAGRRRQWFLGLIPDSSIVHGSQPPLSQLQQSHQHISHFTSHHEQYAWSLMPGGQFTLSENAESADSISISMMLDWDRLLATVPSDGSSGNQLNPQRQEHGAHSTSLQPPARDEQTFGWSGNQHQQAPLQQQGQHGYYQDENQQQLHQPQFDLAMMCGSDYVHSSLNSSASPLVGHSAPAVGSGSQMTMTASTLSFALG